MATLNTKVKKYLEEEAEKERNQLAESSEESKRNKKEHEDK